MVLPKFFIAKSHRNGGSSQNGGRPMNENPRRPDLDNSTVTDLNMEKIRAKPTKSSTSLSKPRRFFGSDGFIQSKEYKLDAPSNSGQQIFDGEASREEKKFDHLKQLRRDDQQKQRPEPPTLVDLPFEITLPPGEVHPWGRYPAAKNDNWV